jgi:hypothetical protein
LTTRWLRTVRIANQPAVSGGQGIAPGLDLSREERLSKCNACWSD